MSGSEFRAWRKALGMRQEDAAAALGVSRRIVQMYEHDELPVPRAIELACEALTEREKHELGCDRQGNR